MVQSETDSEDGEEIEMVELFINQRESRSNRTTSASNNNNKRITETKLWMQALTDTDGTVNMNGIRGQKRKTFPKNSKQLPLCQK